MSDTTPRDHAAAAAEAIRALNHATLSKVPGWEYPGDAYDVVGGLDQMANMLGQTLDQIAQHIERLSTLGHIRSDKGGDGAEDVHSALRALEWGRADAASLASRLGTAHSALSALAFQD